MIEKVLRYLVGAAAVVVVGAAIAWTALFFQRVSSYEVRIDGIEQFLVKQVQQAQAARQPQAEGPAQPAQPAQ